MSHADSLPATTKRHYADSTSTHLLDLSPGNGSRYRLVVVLHQGAIRCIAWPDVGWSCGDLGSFVSAEWLAASAARGRKRGEAAFTRADADEIAKAVNELVRRQDPRQLELEVHRGA